jgi:hypothetical protein
MTSYVPLTIKYNFDKTNFIKFAANNKTVINLNIGYVNKTIEKVGTTRFCGLQIDDNLNWKTA